MTEEEWLQGVNGGILFEGLCRDFKVARTKAGKRRPPKRQRAPRLGAR